MLGDIPESRVKSIYRTGQQTSDIGYWIFINDKQRICIVLALGHFNGGLGLHSDWNFGKSLSYFRRLPVLMSRPRQYRKRTFL